MQDIVLAHVRNIYLGRRNFHYLMSGLVLDDAWVPDVAEYYAVNVTGLRLVSPEKRKVKNILKEWKKLDKKKNMVIFEIRLFDKIFHQCIRKLELSFKSWCNLYFHFLARGNDWNFCKWRFSI